MVWEQLFEHHILERGYDYYIQERIEALSISKDSIKATVLGNEPYDVYIEIENGEIADINCNCPYADEGNYCKHMAAVLYCMEADNEEEEDDDHDHINTTLTQIKPEIEECIDQLVERADELLIRS